VRERICLEARSDVEKLKPSDLVLGEQFKALYTRLISTVPTTSQRGSEFVI
jgi:hypothetical protein